MFPQCKTRLNRLLGLTVVSGGLALSASLAWCDELLIRAPAISEEVSVDEPSTDQIELLAPMNQPASTKETKQKTATTINELPSFMKMIVAPPQPRLLPPTDETDESDANEAEVDWNGFDDPQFDSTDETHEFPASTDLSADSPIIDYPSPEQQPLLAMNQDTEIIHQRQRATSRDTFDSPQIPRSPDESVPADADLQQLESLPTPAPANESPENTPLDRDTSLPEGSGNQAPAVSVESGSSSVPVYSIHENGEAIGNTPSLEDCGCEPVWFENCCAPWVAQFDTMVLFRQGGDTATPVLNCDCDVTVIRPRAFDSWDEGLRGRLRRDDIFCGWGLESVYWQMDDWNDRFNFSGIGHTLVGVNIGNGTSSVAYQSELNTFELNTTKYVTNWTQVGFGFRWLNLDEVATATGNGSIVPNFNRRAVTNNDLYGGQVVVNHTFWDRGGPLVLNARAAAGVYHNQIDRITRGFGTSPLNDDGTSFVGEGEVTAQYYLTDHCSLQIGYQCMWLTNVALAIDQFFDAGAIRSNGDLFLNGLTFGFGLEW